MDAISRRLSVLDEVRCADAFSFMFWLRAFMLKVPKNWFFECYISCWLCGPVAFTLDFFCFVAVLSASRELNSTKIRPIPREQSTECTCDVETGLECDQIVKKYLFFGPSSILLVKLKTQEIQKQELLTIWVWFQEEDAGYCFVALEAFCQRRCVHTIAMSHKQPEVSPSWNHTAESKKEVLTIFSLWLCWVCKAVQVSDGRRWRNSCMTGQKRVK